MLGSALALHNQQRPILPMKTSKSIMLSLQKTSFPSA
jgi:hypothetical protein